MKKLFVFIVLFYFAAPWAISLFAKESTIPSLESLIYEGKESRFQGDNDKAIRAFDRALKLIRVSSGKNPLEAEVLMNLGVLLWNSGEIQLSLDNYLQAEASADNLGQKSLAQTCRKAIRLTRLYLEAKDFRDNKKKYKESNKAFEEAISIAKEIESGEHQIKCLRQLSISYYETRDFLAFFRLSSEAQELAKKLNVKRELGLISYNIGRYYLQSNVYSLALKDFELSLEIAMELNSLADQADCLVVIGNTYSDLGQYDRALEYLNSTLNIHEKLHDEEGLARDQLNIGVAYRRRGFLANNKDDLTKALQCYRQALSFYQNQKANSVQIIILNNIGSVYFDLADYAQAMNYFQEGLALAESTGFTEKTGLILNNIGLVQATLGNFERSTDYYQRAIDQALKNNDERTLWEAYLEKANALKKQGRAFQAVEYYQNSIKVIEDIRSKISLEEQKASFLGSDKRIEPYQQLIDLYAELSRTSPAAGYQQQAFSYLEKAKARTFLDSLEAAGIDLAQPVDMKLLNREKEISSDLSKIYLTLSQPDLPEPQKENLQAKLRSLETEYEALKQDMRQENPAYAGLRYPENITLEETQRSLLDSRTAIWAYSLGQERSLSFVITRDKMTVSLLPSRRELQAKVTEYLKIISDKDSPDLAAGSELSRILIPADLDPQIESVIILPDDWLNFLPFEALPLAGAAQNWLIQKYRISYIPSVSSYRELLRRGNSRARNIPMDLLAVGNPLPAPTQQVPRTNGELKYSGREVRTIATLFSPSRIRTADGEQATESSLKALPLNEYRILHFATHATIDDRNPNRSFLLLAPSKTGDEDGFLQTREILNLKTNADLVTLSACRTGLGQLIRGEGVEGLSRAFFYSGASAVLMSLWSIDDQASSQLMERFYTHLRSSESPAEALRRTKMELIESGTLSHPFYWAGFIVSGKADTRIFQRSRTRDILLAIGLFLAAASAALLAGMRRKRRSGLLR